MYLVGCPTHIAVGTDLFEIIISGLFGTLTYGSKGRIEIWGVFVMLAGAAVGAQIGTVATKYAKGFGIRIAFGIAVVCCMVSVILKQYKFDISAAVVILGAITAISLYICWTMFSGAAKELREKKAAAKLAA